MKPGRWLQTTAPETITDRQRNASQTVALDSFARALTEYGMYASPKRIAQQMRQAYGDRWPGSHQRWLDQQPEREFYRRVQAPTPPLEDHPEPVEPEVKIPPKEYVNLTNYRLVHTEPEPECEDCPEVAA